MAVSVTSENFESEVVKSDIPVIVDFWAEWCVPCRMVGPVLEELGKSHAGKVKVVKVNVDEAPDLASEYGIVSIPTMITFLNGEEKSRLVGAAPKETLEKKLITPHTS